MSSEAPWLPSHPDPALATPLPRGVHPHVHEPDRMHGWVFLQHQVWVDYWGNEHEVDSMPGDYVANVIRFCEERAERIQLMVLVEIAYKAGLRLAGLSAGPTEVDFQLASSAAIEKNGDALKRWLHDLPLLVALDGRAAANGGEQ